MPSSADEGLAQERNILDRKDSPRQAPQTKKQKKKSKKSASVRVVEDTNNESASPPLDLLAPPPFDEERLLSSSPEANLSEPEPSYQEPSYLDAPPVLTQNIDNADDVVEDLRPGQIDSEPKTLPANANGTTLQYGKSGTDFVLHDGLLAFPRGGLAERTTALTPPSTSVSPPNLQARLNTSSQSPKPQVYTGHQSGRRSDTRTMMAYPSQPSVADHPPPHLPQKHFSRLPDAAFGLSTTAPEVPPGSGNFYCGFDTLDGASTSSQEVANNILLIGSEGALDICRYNRQRREVIGRLEGLRGSALEAKVLSNPGADDPFREYRPLVACVLYGPIIDEIGVQDSSIRAYQSSVEVFSLKKSRSLGTIWRSAPQQLPYAFGDSLFQEPQPKGAITVASDAGYVLVTSGESGEVFVFIPSESDVKGEEPQFRCAAKFWTRVRSDTQILDDEIPSSAQAPLSTTIRTVPIMSLSRRWLAISPPMLSSSQKSIDGIASVSATHSPPLGVSAYVSPAPATVDCEVDAPVGPGLLNRVTKQATNEIRKGAQWIGDQSMSVIKGYWNRNTTNNSPTSPGHARRPGFEETSSSFPPTHAHGREDQEVKVEAALISIIDLNRILDFEAGRVKNGLLPLSTFSLPDGCSFLSFAPSGLMLLSTNHIGDCSTIWDLTRVTDSRATANMKHTTPQLPGSIGVVSKISALTRVSPSSVVDVRWSVASNRVGILTSKGTLHLHELPRYDFTSSTPRPSTSPTGIAIADRLSPAGSPQDANSGWMNNVRSGWQNVSGRLNAIRTASDSGGGLVTSTRQSFNQASVAARYASGRAVRNGYNSALEGAYSLRHSQDNKIRLKSLHHQVRPGCFRWLSGKEEGIISTVADGSLCTYTIRSNYHVQGKRTIVVLDASRKAGPSQTLPGITSSSLPPAVLGWLNPTGPHASCARAGVHGFWTLNRDPAALSPQVNPLQLAGDVQQDKETCPQYSPLHRLRQVRLYTYDERNARKTENSLGFGFGSKQPWLFGLPSAPSEKANIQRSKAKATFDNDEPTLDGVIGHMEDDFELDDALLADSSGFSQSVGASHGRNQNLL